MTNGEIKLYSSNLVLDSLLARTGRVQMDGSSKLTVHSCIEAEDFTIVVDLNDIELANDTEIVEITNCLNTPEVNIQFINQHACTTPSYTTNNLLILFRVDLETESEGCTPTTSTTMSTTTITQGEISNANHFLISILMLILFLTL